MSAKEASVVHAGTTDRRFATTLARGLAVLRAFRESDDGLGNTELAERTGLPKSTVSRLTFTLRALGYLSHARRHDRYRPGPALLALGNIASAANPFVEQADAPMQALADATGTLALLAVRDDCRVLLARTWRPRAVGSLWLEVGHRLPLGGTSSGHALLAALSATQYESALEMAIGDHDLTRERADEIRAVARGQLVEDGFVIADPSCYFSPNIHAVSVPFLARELAEPVVFSCGAIAGDLPLQRLHAQVGPALRHCVSEVATATGSEAAMARLSGELLRQQTSRSRETIHEHGTGSAQGPHSASDAGSQHKAANDTGSRS